MHGLALTVSILILALAGGAAIPQATPPATPGGASNSGQLGSTVMQGTIGPYRIGLNYTVSNGSALVAAHYFYASQLKNIALTGAVHGESVSFQGADGSRFDLHFVGNGSNGNQPLTFNNSVGMRGSWSLGGRTLPVDLRIGGSTANPGQRLYADVTSEPDAVFEAMVKATQGAILSGDRSAAAQHVHFPLRVNEPHGPLILRSAAELDAHWSRIFTPAFLTKLKTDVPHEMFVHNGQAMLGDGELWFDAQGLTSINPLMGH